MSCPRRSSTTNTAARSWTRGIGLVSVLVLAVFGLTACGPSPPLGVRKDGDKLTILVGYQCSGSRQPLSLLRVSNYDRGSHKLAGPPLWEIQADKPRPTPVVVLGVLPEGFHENVNNLGSQKLGGTLAVDVEAGRSYSPLFDVKDMRDDAVLNSEGRVGSEEEFTKKYRCT